MPTLSGSDGMGLTVFQASILFFKKREKSDFF
jgi:hypothetical protein